MLEDDTAVALRSDQDAVLIEDEPIHGFNRDIIETGRDISRLIHLARKIDLARIEAVILEIERVKFSPFAAIPEGALEEARAAAEFVQKLKEI